MRIGIDIGGTKIEAAALGPDGGIVLRRRVATPGRRLRRGDRGGPRPGRWKWRRRWEPGPASASPCRARCLRPAAWSRIPIPPASTAGPSTGISKRRSGGGCVSPMTPIASRLSEAVDGAGQGAETVFGVILGTGVGGGIVVRGRVLTGRNAIAGEWGHIAPALAQGRRAPRPAVLLRQAWLHRELSFRPGTGPRPPRTDRRGFRRDPARHARFPGDQTAEATMQSMRSGWRARWPRRSICSIPTPSCSAAASGRLNGSTDNVPKLWGRYVFSDNVATRLVPPRWGDSSGVRGAAWLWPEDEKL